MPGRKYSATNGYRYGFNGKELDNEVKGEGNSLDFGARVYDSRLGKFLSIDPLTRKFPTLSPYQYASNTPIMAVDLDGLESLPATELNKYGEKQVHEISTDVIDGNTIITLTGKKIPSNSKPITQGMNEKQICRLAVARMLAPGQFTISKDQYLDEKYFEAEAMVKYYYSNLATSTMTNTKEMRSLTSDIHDKVTSGLFSDDNALSDASLTEIKRRTSFWGKRNIASDAVMLFGGGIAAWARNLSIKSLANLESLGIPKGFGVFADAAKFRIAGNTLNEQLAMKEAMSGGGLGTRTEIISSGNLHDPRLAGADVSKYAYNRKILDANGNVIENIEIHYLKNNKTGVTFDFKFKK